MMIILLVYQKTKVQFFLFITNSLPMFFLHRSEISTFTGTKITHLKQSFYLDLKIDMQEITNKRHDFRSRAFAYFLFQIVVQNLYPISLPCLSLIRSESQCGTSASSVGRSRPCSMESMV